MAVESVSLEPTGELRSRGHLSRAWSRLIRKKLALACMGILIILYSGGILAPWVSVASGYDYDRPDYTAFRAPPSWDHWVGTDRAGRDLFVRLLWGIQNTIIITLTAMLTGSLVIGITLGLVAGYFGGRVDAIINRVGEVFASFPDIFLIIILAATLKPRILQGVRWLEDTTFVDGLVRSGVVDYFVVFMALVAFSWVGMQRLVRGQVLVLRESQYVDAARALGASTPRILFKHVLPNAISPIIVTVSMGMGTMVGTEIILGWLGLGIQPPRPSLGTMLFEGGVSLQIFRNAPWLLLGPGTVAFLMILSWNLLGDALNDVLNPRTR